MPDIFVSDKKDDSGKPATNLRPELGQKRNQASPVDSPRVETRHRITRTVRPDLRRPTSEVSHPKHSMFPLSSFAVDPRGVYFATQGDSEEIHLFLRRHFITNIPWIVFSTLLILLPPFAFPLIAVALPIALVFPPNVTLLLFSFYYIVVFGAVILTSFINWYFNVYIVTNERVVDVDFINILYREVSATRLNLIQDVTVKTGGVVRAVFDYGDVFIQTAGTEVNFDFHAVPHPQQVAREIEKLIEAARKEGGKSELEEAIAR